MLQRHTTFSWSRRLLTALLVCCTQAAGAQSAIRNAALLAELQGLANHAALIFVGQIVSVQRQGSVVEVNFRVEQPVSGATARTYTMREWAGLWPAGHQRYAIGQRVLAFLHGASAAGFSSPVHGAEGLVPVVVQGANVPALLDVRRVAAAVVRAPGTPLLTTANGALPLQQVIASLPRTNPPGNVGLLRSSVPLHAHPPAVMQPHTGPGGLRVTAPSVAALGAPVVQGSAQRRGAYARQ